MTPALPPGTVARAYALGIARLEAERLRVDEDLIGLPLPEPIGRAAPGLVVSVFPLTGGRPGSPSLVFPARAIARLSLPDPVLQIIHPVLPPQPAGEPQVPLGRRLGPGTQPALGPPDRQAPLPARDRNVLKARWTALLDAAAPAVAADDIRDAALRAELRELFAQLSELVLRPVYASLAPRFDAWLRG